MSQLKQDLEFLSNSTTQLLVGYNHDFTAAFSLLMLRKGFSYDKHRIKKPVPYGVDVNEVIESVKTDLVNKLKDMGMGVMSHAVRCKSWSSKHTPLLVHNTDYDADEGVVAHITYNSTPVSVTVSVEGKKDLIEFIMTQYVYDDRKTPSLKRLKAVDGGKRIVTETVPLPDYTSLNKHNMVYPDFIESPAELWSEYSKAKSNVLLMIGDVGTGKSSWLRELLEYRGWNEGNAYIVDSTSVLMAPCFGDFIRELPQGSVLICEDNDMLTQKRTDGNVHMSALLNATSGLIATSMKLIISTNLNNVDEMDKGIIRPGRLFDTLAFRKLTAKEATVLHAELNPENAHQFEVPTSLAEVLNYHERRGTRQCVKTMGFR